MDYAPLLDITDDALADRVVAAWGIGRPKRLGWGLDGDGPGYVSRMLPEHVKPALEKGWRRLKFRAPYSDDSGPGEPMSDTARTRAIAPQTLDFADMVAALPAEVLAYLGSPLSHEYGPLLWTRPGDWLSLRYHNIADLLPLENCDIGRDHAVTLNARYAGMGDRFPPGAWRTSWAFESMIADIKAGQGRRLWVESVPWREAAHHHDQPFICRTFTAKDQQGNPYTQAEWLRSRPHGDWNWPGLSGNENVAPSQVLVDEHGDPTPRLDYDTILGRHSAEEYARAIVAVLARGPEWSWAGAVQYVPGGLPEVARAVRAEAARRIEKQAAGEGE